MRQNDEKRQLRETKRELKRAGRKRVRAQARHLLETAPEDAHLVGEDFGRYATAHLNGIDHDATRRRPVIARDRAEDGGGPPEAEPVH